MNQFKGQPTQDCPEIIQSSSSLKKGSVFQDQKPALCALNSWPNESGRIDTRVNHNRMLGAALPFFVLFCLALFATDALAAQVTLAWDANDPTPDGYRLYQRLSGESFDYDQPVWTGSATTAPIDSLTEGTTYFFVVRAYVGADESGDSNEVEYTPPVEGSADTDPPIVEPDESEDANEVDAVPSLNQAPSANAGGDQTVPSEALVTLNGTGSSDPDGDTLSYAWVQTSGSAVVLPTVTQSSFSFSAPAVSSGSEVLVFTLTVSDPTGITDSDQCQITVEASTTVNQKPVADAGTSQTVPSQSQVTLDGSASYDPEGGTLTYQWHQTNGPIVTLSQTNGMQATFLAPGSLGATITMAFELTVTDSQGASSADTCLVVIGSQGPIDSDGDGVDDYNDAFPDNPDEWVDNDHDDIGDNADTDDDNDGMPDVWETQYGLDPLVSDAGLDADGDGITNLEEYQAGSNPADEGSNNHRPATPAILSPNEMETVMHYNLNIHTSSFSDPDQGDQHSQTQWLIITSSFPHHVALNITLDSFGLTSIRVPRMVLDPGATYTCLVRHFDDSGEASDWSPGIRFTTQTWLDQRSDESPLDLNNDQINDSLQTDIITSLKTYDGKRNVGIILENASNGIKILNADSFDPEDLEGGPPSEIQELPYGMFGYKIAVSKPGQTATIKLLFSDPLDPGMQWYRYNSISGWRTGSESIDINHIEGVAQRQITDGGEEDADGIANGIIVELMGPGSVDTSNTDTETETDSDTETDSGLVGNGTAMSSGGGGCFLQTLTF